MITCVVERGFTSGLYCSISCVHSLYSQHQCILTPVNNLPLQLEHQCSELSSEKQESHVENVKLKTTNDELSRALDNTSQELSLAQEQLAMLQEQAARLQQEKEMWVQVLFVLTLFPFCSEFPTIFGNSLFCLCLHHKQIAISKHVHIIHFKGNLLICLDLGKCTE